ncbi:MAG: STAS domain-containing protein [bacterium]|nr:STAS domain-containing protein [bacterium]
MRILESIESDIAVLKVDGKLMSPPHVVAFHDHVRRLISEHQTVNVVADFSAVAWFGSAMLGVMVASLISLRREGGDLRLTGLNRATKRVMAVTHLTDVFWIGQTVDHGVTSFQTSPSAI